MKALFLAGALALASSSAWAAISISVSVDGGAATSCVITSTGNTAADCGTFTNGAFTVSSLGATSNSPGSANLSDLFGATTQLTNNTGATHTIEFFIFADGFTIPVAGNFISSIGGTVVTGSAADALQYKSCISVTSGTCAGAAIQSATITPAIINPGSYSASTTSVVGALGSPYTMSEDLKITLGGNTNMNFSTSTFVSAVPEPMTFSLMGAGLLGLGLLRKRISRS